MANNITPKQFTEVIDKLRRRLPLVEVDAINHMAAKCRLGAIENIKKDFTLRNKYTIQNIRYTQGTSKRPAVVGATSKIGYMAEQEIGGSIENSMIPSVFSRGGNWGVPIRRKYSKSKLAKLKKFKGNKGAFILAKQVRRGKYKSGILVAGRLNGGKYATYQINKTGIKFVRSLGNKNNMLQPTHWLNRAIRPVLPQGRQFFLHSLDRIGE